MNAIIIVCITLSTLLSAGIGILVTKIKELLIYCTELTIKSQRFTIALLLPSSKALGNVVIKTFVSYLKKYASFEFETLECVTNDDRDRTYKWSEYLASNNIDLICVIGKACTDTLYRTMKTRNRHTPIVSGGVPIEFCDTPLEVMQKHVPLTAATSRIAWSEKMSIVSRVLPNMKRALILFRSIDEISHRNLKEKNSITAALRRHQINWAMHHITNIEKSTELDKEVLENIDLVIVSRSSELMPYVSKITDVCNEHNVPVFSTDIRSENLFIAVSESTEVAVAEKCAQQAMQILEDGKAASNIPINKITGVHHLVIHTQKAHPLTTTTAIGHSLSFSPHIAITLKT